MIAPVLNLNGTSTTTLLSEYVQAAHAVRQAINAVQNITVHGRDFQTAEPGLYAKARDEQVERLRKLESVLDEIQQLQEAVYEQHEQHLGRR